MYEYEGINDAKNIFSWIARKSFYLENKTDPDLDLGLDLESECSSTFELLKSLIYKIKLLKSTPEVNKRCPSIWDVMLGNKLDFKIQP